MSTSDNRFSAGVKAENNKYLEAFSDDGLIDDPAAAPAAGSRDDYIPKISKILHFLSVAFVIPVFIMV